MLFDSVMERYCPTVESLDSVMENYSGEVMEATTRTYAEFRMDHDVDMARLESALYVADALIESQLFDETITMEAAEIVAENAIKDTLVKIRTKLAKLWEKVKAFFVNLKNNIKAFFTKSSEFVKKYESEIKSKAANNKYEVKIYDYKLGAAEDMLDKFASACTKQLDTLCGAVNGVNANSVDQWKAKLYSTTGQKTDLNEKFEEGFWKTACKSSSFADFKDEVIKTFRNGDASKTAVKDLPINSFIEIGKANDIEKVLDKKYKETATVYTKSLEDLKRAENAVDTAGKSDAGENVGQFVRMTATKISRFTALYGDASKLHIDIVKEYQKAAITVCRAIVTHKSVTESYNEYGAGEQAVGESSIMDTLVGMI